jgi:TseV toxin immunity protein TsiV
MRTEGEAGQVEIGEALTLRDETGLTVIEVGLRATLYFKNGHSLERRRAVAACFEEFFGMAGDRLHWVIPKGLRQKDSSLEQAAAALIADLTSESFDEEDSWEFIWHGGEAIDAASNLMIQGFGCQAWKSAPPHNGLSFLSVVFPLTFFSDRPFGLPTLLARWADRLGPLHGYGGIGLSYSPDPFVAFRYGSEIIGFGMRFPGLELDYPIHHALWCKEGIKGGNWLTVLSTGFVDKLGGVEQLAATLGEPFVFTEYSGGVLIRAGSVPELGDRNRQIETPTYARLSKALKPIRIRINGTVTGISRDQFEAWLTRFDE